MKPTNPNAGPVYRCVECGAYIQSMHRHDFVYCKCGATAIDGGFDCTRLVFRCRPPVPANQEPDHA